MVIQTLKAENYEDVAEILCEAFPWYYKTKDDVQSDINDIVEGDGVVLVAVEDGRAVGIIGATPQYGITGWELHPLAVLKKYRGRGFGSSLMTALEREVAKRGGVMIYLGSDDEHNTTSLFGVDLYEDTFDKITNIKNTGGHPYAFYEKHGYKIVGVFPDANGLGKPDIWMAKRIVAATSPSPIINNR